MNKTIDLTKSQAEFVLSDAKYKGLFAGYGFGKSHTMGLCATLDVMHSSSAIVGVYEPYHDLIRTVAWPNVQKWLSEFGIRYTLNKQESTIYTSSSGVGDLYFRSMDNIDALVGYETYSSHIDELDTMTADNAEKAFMKIMGRNRQNPQDVPEKYKKWNELQQRFECVNRISVYTTPEGFKFCYKMWSPNCENAQKNKDFVLFKGRTQDNPTLTDDYINGLKSTYPAALLKAYMEGEFVNLESGTVYYNFDREKHNTQREIAKSDILHVGVDFNVGKTCGIIFVDDLNKTSIVDEVVNQFDTPALIRTLKNRYPEHRIIAYPDNNSSKSRHTSNANITDIRQLKDAGIEVRAKSKNPLITDRVATVVKLIEDDKFFVNVTKCPEITRCLEQQAYNEGVPDKDTGLDHPLDGMGYRIYYSFPMRKPSSKIEFNFVQKT